MSASPLDIRYHPGFPIITNRISNHFCRYLQSSFTNVHVSCSHRNTTIVMSGIYFKLLIFFYRFRFRILHLIPSGSEHIFRHPKITLCHTAISNQYGGISTFYSQRTFRCHHIARRNASACRNRDLGYTHPPVGVYPHLIITCTLRCKYIFIVFNSTDRVLTYPVTSVFFIPGITQNKITRGSSGTSQGCLSF